MNEVAEEDERHMREALAAGALADAARAAHTLQGVAATLGAERLAEAAGRVERAIRKRQGDEELERLVAAAETELEAAIDALAAAAGPGDEEGPAGVPEEDFDAAGFLSAAQRVMRALGEQDMAAVDHFGELRALATAALLRQLAPVESALARLDFQAALDELQAIEQGLAAEAPPGNPLP